MVIEEFIARLEHPDGATHYFHDKRTGMILFFKITPYFGCENWEYWIAGEWAPHPLVTDSPEHRAELMKRLTKLTGAGND
uniref:Uncharacterized protein n=1 Tax=Candidatus Nitrotoga fabula TaxID=2182327 RepID=A0A2X0QVB9_9PROT|nr:protein of unknown function [Candidatus Nitrotoga fabula]